MRKFNQKGFSAVETALLLVIVGLIAFITWYVFKSQNDTTATLENTELSQAQPVKSTASADAVQTKTDSKVGDYLADSKGKALYISDADTAGVSNCSGSCIETWPIYNAASATDKLQDSVTVIKRTDGKSQYAYKGMPLYYYGSEAAGTVSGTSVAGWQVAKP
jgi:predicted lipoprotein with Yx(FWY)xxD motif